MCASGVHEDRGRVACDGCELPTGCCLCPVAAPRAQAPAPGPAALGPARDHARLAERILGSGCRPAPFAASDTAMPASALQGCLVVLADSVAVYATALREAGERVALTRLPCLLPPAERCFVEIRSADEAVRGWGAYLVRVDLRDPRVAKRVRDDPSLRDGAEAALGARWLVMSGLVVGDDDERPMGPVLLHQLYLDDLGALVLHAGTGRSSFSTSMPRLVDADADPDHETFKERCTRRYFVPIALALAFLNCEGSALEVGHGLGSTSGTLFQRLRIEPFEEMVARLAPAVGSRAEAARHLVPGRFEDDRRAPGEPGTTTGLRWVPRTGT